VLYQHRYGWMMRSAEGSVVFLSGSVEKLDDRGGGDSGARVESVKTRSPNGKPHPNKSDMKATRVKAHTWRKWIWHFHFGIQCYLERLFKSLLPLLLLLLPLPAVVQAQYNYTTNNGTITITGYTGSGGDVIIPSTTHGLPVTSIGLWAFAYCSSLTHVTIPNSVTSIGERAFYYCPSLTTITVDALNPVYSSVDGVLFKNGQTTLIQYPMAKGGSYLIPDSVTSIGDNAFSSCYYMTNVTIGTNVTSIGARAFYYCTGLTNVTIGSNATSIEWGAFQSCGNLTGVTIPVSVTNIGSSAFHSCTSLTSVAIPNSVTSIGDAAFQGCTSLTNVAIPNSVTRIGYYAFCYCTSLTSVTIPDTLTSIGIRAFDSCYSLNSVTIGINVTTIGDNAFLSCTSLMSVTIPDSVNSIGSYAFYSCRGLTSVTIGNSVINIGDGAFGDCTSLTKVYFKGNAPSLGDSYVFNGDNDAIVYYFPGTMGWTSTFGGLSTSSWFLPNPLILINSPSYGVKTNRFGFIISWATNIPVVVEACTRLDTALWSPVGTNTLTGGSSYFSDPQWTNSPARFYRLRSP
jgi:hypothetical protein